MYELALLWFLIGHRQNEKNSMAEYRLSKSLEILKPNFIITKRWSYIMGMFTEYEVKVHLIYMMIFNSKWDVKVEIFMFFLFK